MTNDNNPASQALKPENDPIIGHLRLVEDLAVRASLEAKYYNHALDSEGERGIEPDASVHEHRFEHETRTGLALLEAAARWLLDPRGDGEDAERIMALRTEPPTVRARGLMKLVTDLLDYEDELAAGGNPPQTPEPERPNGGRLIRFERKR